MAIALSRSIQVPGSIDSCLLTTSHAAHGWKLQKLWSCTLRSRSWLRWLVMVGISTKCGPLQWNPDLTLGKCSWSKLPQWMIVYHEIVSVRAMRWGWEGFPSRRLSLLSRSCSCEFTPTYDLIITADERSRTHAISGLSHTIAAISIHVGSNYTLPHCRWVLMSSPYT
jgi:hypothetical protein